MTNERLNFATIAGLRDLAEPGEPDPLVEFIDLFLADAPAVLERAKKAAAQRQAEALKQAAHALKGSSSNLGADALAGICLELERAAHVSSWAVADHLLSQAEGEFAAVAEALGRERKQSLGE